MPVQYTFGSATAAIPLSQLDTNFATPITIGNVVAQLGNVVSTIGNVTLTNTTVSSGNVANSITLGTTTNDNASAGYVGEYISSNVVEASAVALTTTVVANVTSISLTAGDWDVSGAVAFVGPSTTTVSALRGGSNTTSATTNYNNGSIFAVGLSTYQTILALVDSEYAIPTFRYSFNTTTTVYLVAQAYFQVNSLSAYGQIRARRIR